TALDPPRQARLTAELTEIARNEALRGGPVPPLELALLVPDEAWLAAQRELAAAWSLPALQVLWSVDPEAAAELLTTRGLAPANLAVTLSFAEWLLRS
ncbi:MAG: hypothetical protein HUU35_14400, partial [Armatimonadetes bacterium]|nr:hypothetical protein [Armatimonadota bacterium]